VDSRCLAENGQNNGDRYEKNLPKVAVIATCLPLIDYPLGP
jgi:hypothetical protein